MREDKKGIHERRGNKTDQVGGLRREVSGGERGDERVGAA